MEDKQQQARRLQLQQQRIACDGYTVTLSG